MITLITGLPGNGKTLYALAWLKDKAEKEGRQVYYSGIADLKLPWIECEPERWFELPKGSIIVIDEVQRVMRPRQHGSVVPEFVAKLETHRHLGVDLVLITQHPMLLDSNVRRLCGQHFHVVRKFGTHNATIHEWGSVKEQCDKNREDSIKHHWRYPKEVFGYYKSAEVHTHKARIPMKVWMFAALPLIIGGLVYTLAQNIYARTQPKEAATADSQVKHAAYTPGGASGGAGAVKTRAEFLAEHTPRVVGLAYTAPVYDEVTKPVQAPYPAACIASATRCKCYSQQGTRLVVPEEMCRDIADGGFFVAWDQSAQRGVYRDKGEPEKTAPRPIYAAAEAIVPAAAGSLGGNPRGHFTAQTEGASSGPSTQDGIAAGRPGRGASAPKM
jgi:zona occludens toxin